jgi:hypothetical protein
VIYPAQSILTAAIGANDTSLILVSAAGFTAPFYLVIDTEIIYCPAAATGGQYSGITRGALNTLAAAHSSAAGAYGLYSTSFMFGVMGGQGGYWPQIAAELATIEARLTAASAAGPSTQQNVLGLRQLAVPYQNQTGKPLYVSVVMSNAGGAEILVTTDSNNPPTTSVAASLDVFNAVNLFLICLPGNYYMVSDPGGVFPLFWTEWS